jgi:hypothetical protein
VAYTDRDANANALANIYCHLDANTDLHIYSRFDINTDSYTYSIAHVYTDTCRPTKPMRHKTVFVIAV